MPRNNTHSFFHSYRRIRVTVVLQALQLAAKALKGGLCDPNLHAARRGAFGLRRHTFAGARREYDRTGGPIDLSVDGTDRFDGALESSLTRRRLPKYGLSATPLSPQPSQTRTPALQPKDGSASAGTTSAANTTAAGDLLHLP